MRECLDRDDVPYRVVESDGGQTGYAPPSESTDDVERQFSDGIEACSAEVFGEEEATDQDLELAADYATTFQSCMAERGVSVEVVEEQRGVYDVRAEGIDQGSVDFQRASGECSELASQQEAERRAALGEN